MIIKFTFKHLPGSHTKDRVIEIQTLDPSMTLTVAKILWQMEQDLNKLSTTRVHIDVIDVVDSNQSTSRKELIK